MEKKPYKSSFLYRLVIKRTIKQWLHYLLNTSLNETYDLTIDEKFFDNSYDDELPINDLRKIKS